LLKVEARTTLRKCVTVLPDELGSDMKRTHTEHGRRNGQGPRTQLDAFAEMTSTPYEISARLKSGREQKAITRRIRKPFASALGYSNSKPKPCSAMNVRTRDRYRVVWHITLC